MVEHVAPISQNVSSVWAPKGSRAAPTATPTPLLVTEYAVAGIEGGAAHQLDSSSAAAFIFRTVGQFDGVADMLSYWTFSAVFEERIPVDTQPEFCGQPHHPVLSPKSRNNCMFGLMTPRGVRKAGWRAFELLHRHAGTQRLDTTVSSPQNDSAIYAMATTNGTSDSLRVFLSWWANPMYNGTENASLAATAPSPPPASPCPGFVALAGDCGGSNLQEASGNTSACGASCNKTAGCGGFSYSGATNYHNCILKSIDGCTSPTHGQFVFYKKLGAPSPPPPPAPPPPPPPTPPPPRLVTVTMAGGQAPKQCTVWLIDSDHANAHKNWVAMGKPNRPSPSQMTALHAASEMQPTPCRMSTQKGGATTVEVTMAPDSAAVLDFSRGGALSVSTARQSDTGLQDGGGPTQCLPNTSIAKITPGLQLVGQALHQSNTLKNATACAQACCEWKGCTSFAFTASSPTPVHVCKVGDSCCELKKGSPKSVENKQFTSGFIDGPPPPPPPKFMCIAGVCSAHPNGSVDQGTCQKSCSPSAIGPFAVSSGNYSLGGYNCGKQEPTTGIWYPTDLAKGSPFPVASFAHGIGGGLVADLVTAVASMGFVVVAPATSKGACTSEAEDQLHALAGSRANPSLHPALAHVDWNRAAVFGHSMGGFATSMAAAAPLGPANNVKAAVLSHGAVGAVNETCSPETCPSGCGVSGFPMPSVGRCVRAPSPGTPAIQVPTLFTTGSADTTVRPNHVYAAFKACPARPKVFVELSGQGHTTKGEQGFDAHFLACHAAGVQSSCERIYGSDAEALCQARKYNRCEVVKSDDPSCKYSTKASCDGDPGCAWCLSGAVPPACNTLAEARALPPSVFKCDKVDRPALL